MEAYGTHEDGADSAFEADRVTELLGDVPAAAERLWTSNRELRGTYSFYNCHELHFWSHSVALACTWLTSRLYPQLP
jgi:hypothetical protein